MGTFAGSSIENYRIYTERSKFKLLYSNLQFKNETFIKISVHGNNGAIFADIHFELQNFIKLGINSWSNNKTGKQINFINV